MKSSQNNIATGTSTIAQISNYVRSFFKTDDSKMQKDDVSNNEVKNELTEELDHSSKVHDFCIDITKLYSSVVYDTPELSAELKEMVKFKKLNYNENDFDDKILSMDEVFPLAKSVFSTVAFKMFELALEMPSFLSTTIAAQVELASSLFIQDLMFDHGTGIFRDQYIYCYLHNYSLVPSSEDNCLRYGSKKIVSEIQKLIDLNHYYLSICYIYSIDGHNYDLVQEFDKSRYVTAVCSIIENIVKLVYFNK